MENKSGYLYIIQEIRSSKKSIKTYKIGYTNNEIRRISELQVGNSTDLIIIKKFFCYNANKLETIVHTKYEKNSIRGEWFTFTDEELMSCIRFIKQEILINNILLHTVNGKNTINTSETPLIKTPRDNKNIESNEIINNSIIASGYKHHCNNCSYGTNDKSNYNKHMKSEAHIQNINLCNVNTISNNIISNNTKQTKIYQCPKCDMILASAPSLSRHKNKNCKSDKFKEKVRSELQQEFELSKAKMELEYKNKLLEQLMEENNNLKNISKTTKPNDA